MNAIPLMQGTKLGFMLTGEMNAHTLTHSPAITAVVCMLTTPLDKHEAGALLRKRREALGLTQDQVAEQAGIPTITQLSEYENGKVSIARSKYFAKLVPVLRLTQEDIKAINPAAVIEMAPAPRYGNGAPIPPVVQHADPLAHVQVPAELQQAFKKFGSALGIPADIDLRSHIPRFEGGAGPETEEDWRDWLMDNRRWLKGS